MNDHEKSQHMNAGSEQQWISLVVTPSISGTIGPKWASKVDTKCTARIETQRRCILLVQWLERDWQTARTRDAIVQDDKRVSVIRSHLFIDITSWLRKAYSASSSSQYSLYFREKTLQLVIRVISSLQLVAIRSVSFRHANHQNHTGSP